MPKISVIVPIYKVEPYLNRCIKSILVQMFTDFELILIDDGSPDGCADICDKYIEKDKRICVIHKINGGLSEARNKGIDWVIANRCCEWISFIDSDDWIHYRYLEALMQAVYEQKVNIAVCGIEKCSIESPMNDYIITSKKIDSKELYLSYAKESVVSVSACGKLYHKDCFRTLRFPLRKQWEDLRTTFMLILASDFCAVIEEKLYFYYLNSDGIVRRPWRPSRLDELEAYEFVLASMKGNPSWVEIYHAMQACYIRAISYSYFMEQNSDIPSLEKQYYAKLLRNKEKDALRIYKKSAGIKFSENRGVYDTAYPTRMKYYWLFTSLFEKARKHLK